MSIKPFQDIYPNISPDAFIDEMAFINGDVHIGAQSSVWPMAVIRGDVNPIRIGVRCSIQDGSVLHCTHESRFSKGNGLYIGDDVTVGHNATLHACKIGNQVLIGMGAVVLDGVMVEDNVMLAAGSVVPPKTKLKSGFLWLGNPVRKIRALSNREKEFLTYSTEHYTKLAQKSYH